MAFLPFKKEAWERVECWLGKDDAKYWSITEVEVRGYSDDLNIAVDRLLKHNRPLKAVKCLYRMILNKKSIDVSKCIQALRATASSNRSYRIDRHYTEKLIKYIQSQPLVADQSQPLVAENDVLEIEWKYLLLMDIENRSASKFSQYKLANEPKFFHKMIKLTYRSTQQDQPQEKLSDEEINNSSKAHQLLYIWNMPPGVQKKGAFDAEHFNDWLKRVITITSESGHLEAAMSCIGKVLIYSPNDPGGLWIHKTIAEALNQPQPSAAKMRHGFRLGLFNARGIRQVDPTGKQEKRIAEKYRQQAEDVENASFQRLAGTLRELALEYDRQAEEDVARHKSML